MESLINVGTLKKEVKCLTCGKNLTGMAVKGYPHSDGYHVNGVKLWLFVECRYCSYQNSFRKLGLSVHDVSG
ncbi:MAG: hypothetical protein QXG41_07185 [Candidatus Caldarchaeum sp.]